MDGSNHKIPRNGPFVLDFEDGKPALRGEVEDKLRAGIWQHYYPNGTLMAEGIYNNGEKCDEWVFNYIDGTKKAEGKYKENLKDGEWIEYDKNDNSIVVNYVRGRKD